MLLVTDDAFEVTEVVTAVTVVTEKHPRQTSLDVGLSRTFGSPSHGDIALKFKAESKLFQKCLSGSTCFQTFSDSFNSLERSSVSSSIEAFLGIHGVSLARVAF